MSMGLYSSAWSQLLIEQPHKHVIMDTDEYYGRKILGVYNLMGRLKLLLGWDIMKGFLEEIEHLSKDLKDELLLIEVKMGIGFRWTFWAMRSAYPEVRM